MSTEHRIALVTATEEPEDLAVMEEWASANLEVGQ